MTTTTTDLSQLLAFARTITEQAGPLALEHFRVPTRVEDKHTRNEYDPVTEADRGVERFLREQIASRYPTHGIIGEEEADSAGSSEFSWIIDPVDGTRAFISGMTAWGIMLGLRQHGRPVGGVIHQPYVGETFCGGNDVATLYRAGKERRLDTRNCVDVSDAILYSTHPSLFSEPADFAAFMGVAERSRLMRYGGDCYAYCLLALGTIDLVIESGLQPYDVQPLIPIIEGAGGVITDRDGQPASNGGFIVAAATESLHAQALELLNR